MEVPGGPQIGLRVRRNGTEKAFNRKDRGDYAENAERTGAMSNNVPGEQRSS
jgi:hypothetical protein